MEIGNKVKIRQDIEYKDYKPELRNYFKNNIGTIVGCDSATWTYIVKFDNGSKYNFRWRHLVKINEEMIEQQKLIEDTIIEIGVKTRNDDGSCKNLEELLFSIAEVLNDLSNEQKNQLRNCIAEIVQIK